MGAKIVLINVGLMLVYMLCGFSLVKMKKAESSHAKSMSGLLIYICGPCMVINAFQSVEYTKETSIKAGWFLLVSLLAQFLFFLIIYALLKNKYNDAKYRVLSAEQKILCKKQIPDKEKGMYSERIEKQSQLGFALY